MPIHFPDVLIPQPKLLGSGIWKLQKLSEVTVLFGKNGSGKSLLLRSWRDQCKSNAHYVCPERTGEIDFQPQYVSEELREEGRRNGAQRNLEPSYRNRIIARIQSYFTLRGNYREDHKAPVSPEIIEKFMNMLISDFSVELDPRNVPPYKLIRVNGGEQVTRVDQLSSGEAQLLTIALDILTIAAIWELEAKLQRLVLIDEPDAHIHPDLQARFADFIFRTMEDFNLQIVIATHSTSLLAALGLFGGDKTGAIYLNRNRLDYKSQIFKKIHKDLSACLGGHVLMGPLFGAPFLLVEGDDDYRIWSQVSRSGLTNFAVIPCQGAEEVKRYQKTLENILNSLRDSETKPCGYALLDSDKPLPNPNPQNQQCHIPFLQLACHEAENLYLSDEVLEAIGTNWELASNLIVARADDFGNKAEFLKTAKDWDRKKKDIKNVIQQVAQIVDKKPIEWTVRIGQVLGQKRPLGQIADFLSESVIDALWPNNM